jgi:aryl-alcohol dehydrogenase-like predicted oxidoreductase
MHMNRRESLRLIAAAMGAAALPGMAMSATGDTAILNRKIPSSGESIPAIGLGTWQTFDVGAGPDERAPLEEVLREFVALGGRLIDSSPMYGNSEEVVGDLATGLGLRQKLFIATKVWTSGKSAGITQMEDSMRRLHADPIDLMQVHNLVDVETQLETLNAWKRTGRVRHIGVTHYHAGSHAAVARVIGEHPVDFIQINYSVAEREAEQRLLPLAKERGIAVIVNRPFAGGDVFRRIRSKPLPAWASDIDCDTWAQVLLKFVLSHPAVTCAIPATAKVAHLRDNMKAGRGRMPDAAMCAQIAAEAL